MSLVDTHKASEFYLWQARHKYLLVDTHKASELTKIPEQTLRKGRTKAAGSLQVPPHIKEGDRVFYVEESLKNWLK